MTVLTDTRVRVRKERKKKKRESKHHVVVFQI